MGGGREFKEGGVTCIPTADPCWHTAEVNTTLWDNFPSIINKLGGKYVFLLLECSEKYNGLSSEIFLPKIYNLNATLFLACTQLSIVNSRKWLLLIIQLYKRLSCNLVQMPTDSAPWGEFRMEKKKQDEELCALDKQALIYLDEHLRKNFNNYRCLPLSKNRKVLKIWTWDICSLWLAVIFYQDYPWLAKNKKKST